MSTAKNKWPSKRVGEIDYRGIDWSNELEGSETITDESYSVVDGSTLVIGTVTKTGMITTVRLSGGTAGITESVVAQITTSTGRVLEVEMLLAVK